MQHSPHTATPTEACRNPDIPDGLCQPNLDHAKQRCLAIDSGLNPLTLLSQAPRPHSTTGRAHDYFLITQKKQPLRPRPTHSNKHCQVAPRFCQRVARIGVSRTRRPDLEDPTQKTRPQTRTCKERKKSQLMARATNKSIQALTAKHTQCEAGERLRERKGG